MYYVCICYFINCTYCNNPRFMDLTNLYKIPFLVFEQPFKDEPQTALFKDPVRTAL